MKDYHRAWLSLYSEKLQDGVLIGNEVGLKPNATSLKNGKNRKSFSLQSDLVIDQEKPLNDHVMWVLEQCQGKFGKIKEFLLKPGNTGKLFIYITSEHEAAYAELKADIINRFSLANLDISVKIEALS